MSLRTFLGVFVILGLLVAVCMYAQQAGDSKQRPDVTNTSIPKYTNLPQGRSANAAASLEGKIYVVGGYSKGFFSNGYLGRVDVLDIRTGKWSRKKDLLVPRCFHAVVPVSGKLYVLGGMNAEINSIEVVEVYDPKQDRWFQVTTLPRGRNRLDAVALGSKIYLITGVLQNSKWSCNKRCFCG